jgi:hypothetical protein
MIRITDGNITATNAYVKIPCPALITKVELRTRQGASSFTLPLTAYDASTLSFEAWGSGGGGGYGASGGDNGGGGAGGSYQSHNLFVGTTVLPGAAFDFIIGGTASGGTSVSTQGTKASDTTVSNATPTVICRANAGAPGDTGGNFGQGTTTGQTGNGNAFRGGSGGVGTVGANGGGGGGAAGDTALGGDAGSGTGAGTAGANNPSNGSGGAANGGNGVIYGGGGAGGYNASNGGSGAQGCIRITYTVFEYGQ